MQYTKAIKVIKTDWYEISQCQNYKVSNRRLVAKNVCLENNFCKKHPKRVYNKASRKNIKSNAGCMYLPVQFYLKGWLLLMHLFW